MRNARFQKAKSLRAARGSARLRNINPPQISSNVRMTHRFRFISSAAVSGITITSDSLMNCAGGIGTVTNSTISLCYESVRLKKVEVWAPPASQGAAATVSVEWLGQNSPSIEISDTTISVSQNAHVVGAPPRTSLAAFWQVVGSPQNLFVLTCPTGSVVDFEADYLFVDRSTAAGTQAGLTTVVIGNVYFLALDSKAGTHVLVPVSLNTTF
jgi:hypothetical protein